MRIPGLKSEFVRHVAMLMAGRTGAMLVSFMLIPVIARLFLPEHFGSAAIFSATMTILGGIASLKYPRAAILPKDENAADDLLVLSTQLLNAFVIICYLLLGGLLALGKELPFRDTLGVWVWLLPFGVWLYGATEIMMSISNREKTYRVMSISDISQSLTTSGSRVAAGLLFGSSTAWLVMTYMAGYVVRVAMLGSRKWNILRLSLHWPNWKALMARAREYKDFPLFDTPASLAASLSTKIPIFAMGFLFSPAAAGFYAMADRLIGLPMQTAGNSIRRVFLRKVAGLRAEGKSVSGPYWKVVMVLIASGFLPFLVLLHGAEEIMAVVLGENWRTAGRYAEILSPWLFSAWVTMVVPSTMIAFRRQRLWAGMQVSSVLLRIAVFVVAYQLLWEPEYVLGIFVWVNVTIGFALLLLAWRTIKVGESLPFEH